MRHRKYSNLYPTEMFANKLERIMTNYTEQLKINNRKLCDYCAVGAQINLLSNVHNNRPQNAAAWRNTIPHSIVCLRELCLRYHRKCSTHTIPCTASILWSIYNVHNKTQVVSTTSCRHRRSMCVNEESDVTQRLVVTMSIVLYAQFAQCIISILLCVFKYRCKYTCLVVIGMGSCCDWNK